MFHILMIEEGTTIKETFGSTPFGEKVMQFLSVVALVQSPSLTLFFMISYYIFKTRIGLFFDEQKLDFLPKLLFQE